MSPLDMEPDMEDDTLDMPKHVTRFEAILVRNSDGFEPINSWRAQDVATAFACLHRELLDRGADVPDAPALETDDGV